MKKARLTYRISEPCHENWEKMSPDEKGRFCNSCAKPVVDFTNMTDRQIHRTMETANGSVCGRMTVSQVNREMNLHQVSQPVFSLRALMLGTALSTFSAVQSCAQGNVTKTEHRHRQPQSETEETLKGEVVKEPVLMGDVELIRREKISGKVVDYQHNSFIAGTSVTLYDEAGQELSTTLANDKGAFELILDYDRNPYRLVFRREDYAEQSYLIADLNSLRDIEIVLYRRDQLIMGKVAPDKR